jgi:hypothetical protein
MAATRATGRGIGLVLLLLVLGAQLHLLSDLDSGQLGTHGCPVCSLLSFVILLSLPRLSSLPFQRRPDSAISAAVTAQDVFRSTSPRAPPAL